WKLSGGAAHVTDHSNAALTLLQNAESLTYDDGLLNTLSIPRDILPELHRSSEVYATTDPGAFFGVRVPIAGAAGDQQIAVLGQACLAPGTAKNTYSSGSFINLNTGGRYLPPANGLFAPVLWTIGETVVYGLEGKADVAGDALHWLRDGLGIIRELSEVEGLASQVSDTQGVYFVPPLGGPDVVQAGAYARGAIMGITRGITRHHIARAALEAMAYQTRDFFEEIKHRAPDLTPEVLRADGRVAKSDFLLQFQADILGIPVERPVMTNTAAVGAAFLAGLAVGFWSSIEEVAGCWRRETRFEPRLSYDRREEWYDGWRRAMAQVKRPGASH
ncbi:MAG TPA: FGGY-family carbohydrate kinase, partial [Anaerolineales bacterium]|nr:FGGY-family carbohydrate kinase [Anaerolineales bacterium]